MGPGALKYKEVTSGAICLSKGNRLASLLPLPIFPSPLLTLPPLPPTPMIHPRIPFLFIPKQDIQFPQTAKGNWPDKNWPRKLGFLG